MWSRSSGNLQEKEGENEKGQPTSSEAQYMQNSNKQSLDSKINVQNAQSFSNIFLFNIFSEKTCFDKII